MTKLVEFIAGFLARWNDPVPLLDVFDSADPLTIAQLLDAFCLATFGSSLQETLFFEVSQGVVSGFLLQNGQRVVVKVHPPRRSRAELVAVVQVQQYLIKHDYPCPRPLIMPTPLIHGLAMAEELVDEGIYTDAHDPLIRRSLVQMLARLIDLTRDYETIPGLNPLALDRRLPADRLWPTPHNHIFNFEATAVGAEWIDAIAWQAKEALANSAGQLALGHMDWSVKHFRYVDGHVRVIYDWDSLALDKEPAIVGNIAVSFIYAEYLPVGVSRQPTRAESQAFIAEYEAARGKPFTANERRTLLAAANYGQAYGARCWHSLHPQENKYPAGAAPTTFVHYNDLFQEL